MIHSLLRTAALALACLAAPLAAQTATSVRAPAGFAPVQAPCIQQSDGSCTPVSASNPLPVTGGTGGGGSGASADQVQGNVASGAADVGNPVKVGGKATSGTGLSAVTAGQRIDAAYNQGGQAQVQIGNVFALADGMTNGAAGFFVNNVGNVAADAAGVVRIQMFNGASYDVLRGSTNGLFVVNKGGSNLATAQVSAGTSATLLAAARPGRQKVTVSVGAANACAFGNSGVTTTSGFALQPTAGATLTLDTAAALYAACSAATTISVMEQY